MVNQISFLLIKNIIVVRLKNENKYRKLKGDKGSFIFYMFSVSQCLGILPYQRQRGGNMKELTPEEKEQLQAMIDKQTLEQHLKKSTTIYAGFWRRFFASFIDGILQLIAGYIIRAFLKMILSSPIGKSSFGEPFLLLFFLSNLLIFWLYYAIIESSSCQATIGKMMLGIMVTDLNGNRVSFFRASNRTFAKILSAFLLYFGFVMAGFTEKKQALHDIIAGCLVMRR